MRAKIFISIFIAALLLPFALYAVFGQLADKTNYENRTMTSFADVLSSKIKKMPSAFEDWLNDSAPFRNEFMTLNAAINLDVFGTIQSGEVLLGQDDWLFYKNVSDSKSLDDYQGLNPYSDEQLKQIADSLTALNDALSAKGVKFALILAPNKERVYSRYMPQSVPVVGAAKTDLLMEYLAQNTDVSVIYPKTELEAAGEAQQVYYKYDTHWNEAGAFIAVKQLEAALYGDSDMFNNVSFAKGGKTEKVDLANISSTNKLLPDDYDFSCEGFLPNVKADIKDTDETGYVTNCTSNAESGKTLLMLRDSFGSAMLPTISKCYDTASIIHLNAFEKAAPAANENTVFVLELAERSTDRLINYLPKLVEWAKI